MRDLRHSGRPESAAPINRESQFAVDELFISVTDRKGVIRLGNDVFVRVSKFSREELVGQPHNIIRHPDMPRCVFQALWDFLEAGKQVAAYVKNKARDGSYYWVMAVVVPARGGYASVRLKPTTPLRGKVEGIYAELLAVEQSIEGEDPRQRKRAIAASMARLGEILAAEGFDSYEAFMRAALVAELDARAAACSGGSPQLACAGSELHGILDVCQSTAGFLEDLGANLGEYAKLSDTLAAKSQFVLGLAESMRLFSLNAVLASSRVGNSAALGAVAQILRAQSDAASTPVHGLSSEITHTVALLGDMGFRIAAAKLQTEMMTAFVCETASHGGLTDGAVEQLSVLADVVAEAVEQLLSCLQSLDDRLEALTSDADALERTLNRIRSIEVNGRVEAAHAVDSQGVRTLFEAIATQVGEAQAEMADFDAIRRLVSEKDRRTEARARRRIGQLKVAVAALERGHLQLAA